MPEWFWIVLFGNDKRRDLKVLDERPTEAPTPYTEFVIVDGTIDRATADWTVERWTRTDSVGGFEQIWQEANDPRIKGARWSILKELTLAHEAHAKQGLELARMQKEHYSALYRSNRPPS